MSNALGYGIPGSGLPLWDTMGAFGLKRLKSGIGAPQEGSADTRCTSWLAVTVSLASVTRHVTLTSRFDLRGRPRVGRHQRLEFRSSRSEQIAAFGVHTRKPTPTRDFSLFMERLGGPGADPALAKNTS